MSLSRQQITLLGIFALFFGPLLLVMMMRSSWWQYQPSGLKNQGYLVQPPVSLPLERTQSIEDKWVILYVLDEPCEQACIERVTALRQIHRAAGRHAEHLAIVLLSDKTADADLQSRLTSIYPEFALISDSGDNAINMLSEVNANVKAGGSGSADVQTYILDPMLNVILAYGKNANPSDMHKDLKRLLKWSDQESRK